MKKPVAILVGSIFVMGCIIGCGKLVIKNIEERSRNSQQTKVSSNVSKNDFTKRNSLETTEDVKDDLWNKIRLNCGGSVIAEMNETVKQDSWDYHVNSAYVTKQKGQWENPDWNEYKFDEDGNLVNQYSFFVINITIDCISEPKTELYLNSMNLQVFGKEGECVMGYEMGTAELGKKMSRSFFKQELSVNEKLITNVVFIVEDEMLKADKYFLLSINNTGMGIGSVNADDHSYIKISYKEDENESTTED